MSNRPQLLTVRTATIRHLRLGVVDLTRSLRFYREILGLELIWRTESEAAVRCGQADLILSLSSLRRPACRIEIAVADPEERIALRERLELLAVPSFLHAEPGPGPGTILLLDPDGHEIVIEVG